MFTRVDDDEFIPPPRPNNTLGKPGAGEDRSTQYDENGPEDRSALAYQRSLPLGDYDESNSHIDSSSSSSESDTVLDVAFDNLYDIQYTGREILDKLARTSSLSLNDIDIILKGMNASSNRAIDGKMATFAKIEGQMKRELSSLRHDSKTIEMQVKVEELIDDVVDARLSLERDLKKRFKESNGDVDQ